MVWGAGGRFFLELWGRMGLYSLLQRSVSTCASNSVSNTSRSSNSSLSFPLNDSMYPFSQGLPGSMYRVATPSSCNQSLTALAVNSGPLSERMYWGGSASGQEKSVKLIQHVLCSEPSPHHDTQTLPGVFIQNGQQAQRSPIRGPVHYEIIAPYMVFEFRPQSYTRPIIQPKPFPFGLLLRHLESFTSPDPFHPFMIHMPSFPFQHGRYPPISIPAIFCGQFYGA